jgi:subtilisin family serine protease
MAHTTRARCGRAAASVVTALAVTALTSVAQIAGALPAPKTKSTLYFHSGGSRRPLVVPADLVAVDAASKTAAAAVLTAVEQQRFSQLGVKIVPRSALSATDKKNGVLGDPVWFDVEKGAVAVMPAEIVVRVRDKAGLAALRKSAGLRGLAVAGFKDGVYLATYSTPAAALRAANALKEADQALFAHPNFWLPKDWRGGGDAAAKRASRSVVPGVDAFFPSQWHLENTGQLGGTAGADAHVRSAWSVTKGSAKVRIAVIDGGFEITHPDLAGTFELNSRDTPGNGVDDDHNGYIDDVRGWNFKLGNDDVYAGLYNDHGTPVAGLVAAPENGRGIIGVCPRCRLILIAANWKAADDAAAFFYAKSRGAQVITNSWGYPVGTPETDVVIDAVDDVAATSRDGKGAVVLFAMNNLAQDDCVGATPDISSLDSVVAVSATNDQDKKVAQSAWGACMEVLAPTRETGRQGITTVDKSGAAGYNTGRRAADLPDVAYTNDFGGTSAATPITAGVFGLLFAVRPELTRAEAVEIVLSTADKIDPAAAHYDPVTGFSMKYGHGRINAARAVQAAAGLNKRATATPGSSFFR